MEFRRITGPAAVRLHHHRRAEGRGPASRRATSSTSGSATPTSRRPRSRSTSWPRPPTTPATTATRRAGASRSCARPCADLYQRRFDVDLDPDTEVITTIGAKEGFSHLMWVLLGPGDAALVPSPSYPIHIWGPLFAGADVREVPLGHRRATSSSACSEALRVLVAQAAGDRPARSRTTPPPRASTSTSSSGSSTSPASSDVVLVHDYAYAELGFDGYAAAVDPPGRRGQGVRRRAVLDDEVVLDGRLADGVPGRQRRGRAGAGQAEELPRLRHVPADPDRRHRHPERGAGLPQARSTRSTSRRRDALCDGLDRIGWEIAEPQGHDVRLGADPRALPRDGLDRVRQDARHARPRWPLSPGVGFGPGGDGYVRFALIENEQRIGQAMRNLQARRSRSSARR